MTVCPECGSAAIKKAGWNVTRKGKKQRLQCTQCGRTFLAPEVVAKP